jgi:hypothetical protein
MINWDDPDSFIGKKFTWYYYPPDNPTKITHLCISSGKKEKENFLRFKSIANNYTFITLIRYLKQRYQSGSLTIEEEEEEEVI